MNDNEALRFYPVPEIVTAICGSEAWHARRGSFVYTIASHPLVSGYCISVAYSPEQQDTGPFETREQAEAACNRAALGLGN